MQLPLRTFRFPLAPLFLIAPFFLWGTAMVAMKGVTPHTTPFFMAGLRLIPAGVLILIVAAFMGRSQPQGWRAWLWITLFAFVDGTLFQGFLGEGLVKTGAGLGSVMIDSQPLVVALMSSWLFHERIGSWGWLGLMLGVTGISLIGLPDEWIFHTISSLVPFISHSSSYDMPLSFMETGEWLMLLAAVSMAVGTILIRFVSRYADPITSTGWHMIIGGLPLWGMSAATESNSFVNLVFSDWVALGYATIFGSAIAYGLFFYFASQGNLTSLSSLTFLTPIFALIFGHLLLDEVLSLLQWGGVGLTLISIYLINQREQLGRKSQTKIGLEANSISTAEKDLQAVNVRARDSESEVLS